MPPIYTVAHASNAKVKQGAGYVILGRNIYIRTGGTWPATPIKGLWVARNEMLGTITDPSTTVWYRVFDKRLPTIGLTISSYGIDPSAPIIDDHSSSYWAEVFWSGSAGSDDDWTVIHDWYKNGGIATSTVTTKGAGGGRSPSIYNRGDTWKVGVAYYNDSAPGTGPYAYNTSTEQTY